VLKLVADHVEIVIWVRCNVANGLVTVKVEVCGGYVCKVLGGFCLFRGYLAFSVVSVVLLLDVLLWLQVQNLGLVLLDRLRGVRLIKRSVCFFG
jgi:hypothetical protein